MDQQFVWIWFILVYCIPQCIAELANMQSLITSGKFQGDIAGVNPNFAQMTFVSRNAVKNRNMRWPGAVVPYVFDAKFTPNEIGTIMQAFDSYRTKTCVRFVPRRSEIDYLYIYKDMGCYSMVGKASGKQDLSLGPGCMYHETIVHELMHALGFWHEHSRADRDQFIRIRWENVAQGMESQFSTVGQVFADYLNEAYDYNSVLHYDRKAFTKNSLDTIEAIPYEKTGVLGQGTDLSDGDLRRINRLYECHNGRFAGAITPERPGISAAPECRDKFGDCGMFKRYCFQEGFTYVMKLYCGETCGYCNKAQGR